MEKLCEEILLLLRTNYVTKLIHPIDGTSHSKKLIQPTRGYVGAFREDRRAVVVVQQVDEEEGGGGEGRLSVVYSGEQDRVSWCQLAVQEAHRGHPAGVRVYGEHTAVERVAHLATAALVFVLSQHCNVAVSLV